MFDLNKIQLINLDDSTENLSESNSKACNEVLGITLKSPSLVASSMQVCN